MNSISQENDPTLEIRTLIEQLQQTAREARAHARAVEQERDGLARRVSAAEQEIESLRLHEEELRSHFVEITAIIRERDAALEELDRRDLALAEARRKSESIARERNEAQRQRDEAQRLLEGSQRASDEQSRLVADTQRQLLALRQARDTAHAQIRDLNTKLGATEDQLAETEYDRDAAKKNAAQHSQETVDLRRQLDLVGTDRDATARHVEQLHAELDEQRKKLLDLTAQKAAEAEHDSAAEAALAEARAQVASLAEERDAARAKSLEQAREIEEVRAQFQALREEAASSSGTALNEADEKIAALEAQNREARHETESLRQLLETVREQLASLQAEAESTAGRQTGAEEQIARLEAERAAALTSLTAAQKQIDHIIRERDQSRQAMTESAIELDGRIKRLQTELAMLEETASRASDYQRQMKDLSARFERQRVETIDLGTQLQTAQREIRTLSADLAEARLQAKFAQAASRGDLRGHPEIVEQFTAPGSLVPIEIDWDEPEESSPSPAAFGTNEPLTEREAKSSLGAMRQCFQAYAKSPTDLSLINELFCLAQAFAERARASGLVAVHRLATSFSALTRGLYEVPEQVNPSTLSTVQQTIDFLGVLMREKTIAQLKDPAKALVYAVDDDLGNCESIMLAMEELGMRTAYSLEPAPSLAELADAHYDLIFLDVNLPGMDGFELCKKIRQLPLHQKTPIIFLTGMATLENRMQSTLCGGNDFLAKPFNLHELSVKAITLLLQAELEID